MQEYQKRILYAKILNAREACAGDSIQGLEIVQDFVRDALNYATSWNAPQQVIDKLRTALTMLTNAKNFKDRLKPDEILCDILNMDLVK